MNVKPHSLLRLAYQTARTDMWQYQSYPHPLSMQRMWRAIVPNLRHPIFVIGAPRSGTSFLGQCLGELVEISYHREPVATKTASRYIYEDTWTFAKGKRFYRQVYSWLMRIHLDGHLRFAEKTPRNCFIVPFLYWAFPDAQFVHIIRDGQDAALSYSKTPWLQSASVKSGQREPGGYFLGPYARFWVEAERRQEFEATSDIHRCIWAWRRHVESALAAVAHLPATQYLEVRYETLLCEPYKEAERLIKFLAISNAISCQRLHKAMTQANSGTVGKWRDELSAAQLNEIKMEAGQLLQKLNYLE